ncbi:hypothetical protein ACTG16_22445 [Aeromonas sp. 23P]
MQNQSEYLNESDRFLAEMVWCGFWFVYDPEADQRVILKWIKPD